MMRKIRTLFSHRDDKPSDLEVNGYESVSPLPLLASTLLNMDTENDDDDDDDDMLSEMTVRNHRTGSVSRMGIPQNAIGTLSFHGINYAVGAQVQSNRQQWKCPTFNCFKAEEYKQILFDVSGKFASGMNAILGPTGCGKSSLLDILADRKESRGVSGSVLVDGARRHPSYKYAVGYVVQDDIFSGTLTVRENLFFSANVRLPKSISTREKIDRISSVIADLSLESCENTRMGNAFLRGVSGGEKKRACIGMELILSPKILFLDEPTTGLDASTARNVMQCLKRLAGQGRTIIFSIHQPSYSIIKLFDTVTFMCKGHCVYHGANNNTVPYFETLGYQCDTHENPTDFVMDILIDASRTPDILNKLTDAYRKSAMHSDMKALAELECSSLSKKNSMHLQTKLPIEAAQSLGKEILYVSQRTLRNSLRNPAMALTQTVVSIIIGFLVGIVFFDLKKTQDPGVQDRLGTIFFIIVNQIFSTMSALEPLLQDRVLFLHEYASGYYRISTYFITKLMCDLLPLRAIPSFFFSVIVYFMTGFHRTASQFFIFLITIIMASVFGAAVCFFVSTLVTTFAVALIIVVLIFAVMMIFSGFLIKLTSIFRWLSWLQWISAIRYASNTLTINEFQGLKFCLTNQTHICPITGESILDDRGIDHGTAWDLWKYFFALTMMAVAFFLLTYFQLHRMKKTK